MDYFGILRISTYPAVAVLAVSAGFYLVLFPMLSAGTGLAALVALPCFYVVFSLKNYGIAIFPKSPNQCFPKLMFIFSTCHL